MAQQLQQVTELKKKISIRDFVKGGGEEAEWAKTREAAELMQALGAQRADEHMYLRQADRLTRGQGTMNEEKELRRSYWKLFQTSKLGLGITSTGAGKRSARQQSEFRTSMIQAYSSANPDPHKKFHWCPILKHWFNAGSTTAAHLFSYAHGQDAMTAIFGSEASSELFSPRNGMIIASIVEEVFDKGFFVMVPRLSDNPSRAQVSLWNASDPKEYKICIVDFDYPEANNDIEPGSSQKWKDLHNTNVEFRSAFRPRARYVFFHYCVQIMRKAWREQGAGDALKKEFGRWYWGTPGRYVPKKMILGLLEEFGHEWEELVEAAMEEDGEENATHTTITGGEGDILLAVISNQVKAGVSSTDDAEEDEDEDEEILAEGGDGEVGGMGLIGDTGDQDGDTR